MLDATAEALSKHILSELPAGASHSREALDSLPIPVRHYLKAVLNRRVRREASLPTSDWFDETNDVVKSASESWEDAVENAARFPSDAWQKAARTASRQILTFLVEPVATVSTFAFTDKASPTSIALVKERMGSFSPYPYLREIAEGYLDKKEFEEIDRPEFEKLLRRIDLRMVREYKAAAWMTLLEPLFELVEEIPGQEGVPRDLLQRFFAAKNRTEIAEALTDESYTADLLRTTLEDLPQGHGAEEAVVTEEETDVEENEKVREKVEVIEPETIESTEPEPLWKTLAKDRQEASATVSEALTSEISDELMDEPDPEEGEPLWKTFSDDNGDDANDIEDAVVEVEPVAPKLPEPKPEPLKSLEIRILGPSATERRDWYASAVTSGSETDYRELLEGLDKAVSWEAAWPILKDVYQANKVEIYSDQIIAFTDAVEAHFNSN